LTPLVSGAPSSAPAAIAALPGQAGLARRHLLAQRPQAAAAGASDHRRRHLLERACCRHVAARRHRCRAGCVAAAGAAVPVAGAARVPAAVWRRRCAGGQPQLGQVGQAAGGATAGGSM
jgi:hypothetical protein